MNVLQVNSSINGNEGVSSQLADDLASRLGDTLVRRDLAKHPVPHLDADTFIAFAVAEGERTPQQRELVALSDQLIEELRAADVLLLALPMYNFGVPSAFKAWIDQVARAGVTFQYTPDGPQGLLGEKRVIVVTTRGGHYAGTPADNHSAYIKQVLGFLGLGDPEFVYVEGLARSEGRDSALAGAIEAIEQLAA